MSRRKKVGLMVAIAAVFCITGVSIWYFSEPRYPDTLPLGQVPSLILPLNDLSHNDYIQGYGQVQPDYFHMGFDFGVNDTTIFVAPAKAYVKNVRLNYFNDKGGHWQSEVALRLNLEWMVALAFESWALDDTTGAMQASAIAVHEGQLVEANQTLGSLLCHGEYAHVHLSVIKNGEHLCPYYYLTDLAKATFSSQFSKVGINPSWEM
ncbi:MAG: hypothetical protein Q6373_000035 [Candidatus Sigynarchaeota archaeon]